MHACPSFFLREAGRFRRVTPVTAGVINFSRVVDAVAGRHVGRHIARSPAASALDSLVAGLDSELLAEENMNRVRNSGLGDMLWVKELPVDGSRTAAAVMVLNVHLQVGMRLGLVTHSQRLLITTYLQRFHKGKNEETVLRKTYRLNCGQVSNRFGDVRNL